MQDMKENTVSVIIPVYNAESTLEQCLDSVLNQTYSKLEIVLVDDGSKDKSLEICNRYAKKDDRIVVLHHQNHGVSYTRNRGLDKTAGEYVVFVDSDDYIDSGWIKSYVDAIKVHNTDLVIGGLTRINRDDSLEESVPPVLGVVGKDIWKYICETESGIFGYVPNKLYKRDVIGNIRFNENMTVQEDFDFALDIYAKAEKIALINETGYFYKFESNKRSTPFLDLIGNQMKLLSFTRELADSNHISFELLANLVVGWTYQYLYESEIDEKYITKCIEVREIQDIDFLYPLCRKHNEKFFVYQLIKEKKYKAVKSWFSFRGTAKKIVRLDLFRRK